MVRIKDNSQNLDGRQLWMFLIVNLLSLRNSVLKGLQYDGAFSRQKYIMMVVAVVWTMTKD